MILVFATHNEHKLQEVRKMINDNIKLLSLNDINFFHDIEENGLSLQENSEIKANAVFRFCSLPCFADDTGLLVDCLNGEPGVRSARYAGDDCDSEKNMDLLLRNMQDCEDRSASFKTAICLKFEGETHFFEGETKGQILKKRQGSNGFGYDPLFLPDNNSKTFGELSTEEKNTISHRYKAIDLLNKFLNNHSSLFLTNN